MTVSGEQQTAVPATAGGQESGWIRLARQADVVAWEQLVRRYQEPVFRLAYLIVGDAADAQEVAQDAFMRAYQSLNKFDPERPFRPWMLQITRNLARNQRRTHGRQWANLIRWWRQEPEPVAPPHRQQEEAQLLWQAVQQLKPAWQEVVYLRFFLELSEAETAATLAIPPGTVKSRLHRALVALKLVIEQDFVELIE